MEKQLEAYLHKHIPISAAMGIKVDLASPQKVILSAPFANNINHKKTVFGGSLHAVATLACWSVLHLNLKEAKDTYQIVISKSDVNYLLPVDADFTVECTIAEHDAWQRFMKMLHAKGKARIQLSAKIYHNNRLAVDYQGTFAAIRDR
jgi:thioesterase domain-containing protein